VKFNNKELTKIIENTSITKKKVKTYIESFVSKPETFTSRFTKTSTAKSFGNSTNLLFTTWFTTVQLSKTDISEVNKGERGNYEIG